MKIVSKYKKHIQKLNRVRASDIVIGDSIYLDKNERTVSFSDDTIQNLRQHLCCNIHKYPNINHYYNSIAAWLHVSSNQLFFTEGVSGAIRTIIEAFANRKDKVYFNNQTYAMYSIYSKIYKLQHVKNPHKADIIFLQNVCLPYGELLTKDYLEYLCYRYPEKPIVLDDVYFGFNVPDYINFINKYDNFFIMRSFSKAFGLASIRLGYIISNSKNISYVSNIRNGYETNLLSLQVAEYFINNIDIQQDYVASVKEAATYFIKELKNLNIKYSGGMSGNFIFLFVDPIIARVLKISNIHCRQYKKGIRITIGTKEQMEQVINILGQIGKYDIQ